MIIPRLRMTNLFCAFALVLSAGMSNAADKPASEKAGEAAGPYQPTWESLKTVPVPRWFDDAKFGIFIHWGPQSIWDSPWADYQNPERAYPALKKQFGATPPDFGYKDAVAMFKAEKWDPEAWAELFQKAGARYVILTGEHHDGFMLGDSELTDWCAAKMGPKRDLIGDLGKAVRARGIMYAPSFHRERHAGMFSQKKFVEKSPPCKDIAEEIRRFPKAEGLYGPFEYSDAFIASFVARWKEWERRYQPDFLWIDNCPFFQVGDKSPQVAKYQDACCRLICEYLNASRQWGKETYFNNKGKVRNWPDGVGCYEKDRMNAEEAAGQKWQCPMTLAGSWFYSVAEEQRDSYKTPPELIHLLCDIVSKNGNLLLNIGPRPDGTIPEGMQKRLLAVGEWLRINGEAIYGTHPWKASGEGEGKAAMPTRAHAIPLRPVEIRYTQKGGVLYAISLNKPAMPLRLTETKGMKVSAVSLLGSPDKVAWTMTDAGLRLEPPPNLSGEHAWVFKITGSQP
ncbi:MAG: alpha-L-fucosidase [Candidatus Sumerlaeota bacterium]|nr:alpha-L-fucosidase [Candidatus Sumerlaeota bacterium]